MKTTITTRNSIGYQRMLHAISIGSQAMTCGWPQGSFGIHVDEGHGRFMKEKYSEGGMKLED